MTITTDEMKQLGEGGFTQEEVASWAVDRRKQLSQAGFNEQEIDTEFGQPHFTPRPLLDHVEQNLTAHAAGEEGKAKVGPQPVRTFADAIEAGFQISDVGLLVRGEMPSKAITPDTNRMLDIAANVTSMAADFPVYVAGGFLGARGGVSGAAASAVALQAGLRRILTDKYQYGEVQNFSDFWSRASGAAMDMLKGWVFGKVTGKVGEKVNAALAPLVSETARKAALMATAIPTMATVGAALEGQVPTRKDFEDAAVAVGFFGATHYVTGKFRNIYAEHGVKPGDVLSDIHRDPTILGDILSDNIKTPRAYHAEDIPEQPVVNVQPGKDATKRVLLTELKEGRVADGSAFRGTTKAELQEIIKDGELKIGQDAEGQPGISASSITPDGFPVYGDGAGYIVPPGKHAESGRVGEVLVDEKTKPEDLKYVIDGKVLSYEEMKGTMAEWEPDKAMGGGAPPRKTPAPGSFEEAQKTILDHIVQDEKTPTLPSLDDLITSYVDKLHPIKVAEREAAADKAAQTGTEASQLPTSKSPYQLERLTAGIFGKGLRWLRYGTTDNNYTETGKSYADILKPVEKDLDGFRAYMMARRAIELSKRGPVGSKEEVKTGFDLDAARRVVEGAPDSFIKAFEERREYKDALLDYMKGAGILSAETIAKMRELNADHVPFYKYFEEETRPSAAKGGRNPIKKIVGSEAKKIDPIESDVKDTFLFLSLAEKNMARQAMVKLGPDFAEKIPQKVKPITLTEPEIEAMFKEFLTVSKQTKTARTETSTTTGAGGKAEDLSKSEKLMKDRVNEALIARGFHQGEASQMMARLMAKDADSSTVTTLIKEIQETTYVPSIDIRLPNDVATIFRAEAILPGSDRLVVYQKGEREVYQVNPKVAEAFNQTDKVSASFLATMLNTPAALLRAGTVVSPDFFPRNLIRDAVSSFVYAVSNPLKTAKGAYSLATKDTAFKNWLMGGGGNATMVAIDRDYINQELIKLNLDTGLLQRSWNVVATPLHLLQAISEAFENSTRLGTVRDKLSVAKDKATIQALSMISRNATVDFNVHGSDEFFQRWTRTAAFMNPGIQGMRQLVEGFQRDPLGVSARAFGAITIPTLYLWWANHDDPRYDDIPRWEKAAFHIVMTKDHIYRIPKDFGLGFVFSTIPESILDAYVAENPNANKGLLDSLITSFGTNIVPTFLAPIVEQFSNHSLFTGNPTIPSNVEKLLPEYQYTEYTTETAKQLGALIGAFPGLKKASLDQKDPFIGGVARALTTPILIENYLHAWSGGLGMYALKIADKGLREAGVLPDPVLPARTLADISFIKAFVVRYPSASAQSIQDFYDSYYEKKRVYDTILAKAQEGDPESVMKSMTFDPSAIVQLDGIREALTQHSSLVRLIYKNPDIAADEKRQLIDTIYFRMSELAHAGNTTLREIEKATK